MTTDQLTRSVRVFWVIILLILPISSVSANSCQGAKKEVFWQKHSMAKKSLITAFKQNANRSDYVDAVYDIVKYETFLLRHCVNPQDKRLVSGIIANEQFNKGLTNTYPALAYRILKAEIKKQRGYVPQIEQLFTHQQYTLTKR